MSNTVLPGQNTLSSKIAPSRADLGRGAWGAEASPPPKFYHVQARKLLEVAI